MEIKEAIEKYKIITIIRNAKTPQLTKAVHVMYEAGLRLFEVTLNQASMQTIQENADQIKELNNEFGDDIFLGAGTVMNGEQVKMVHDAGAKYIISPHASEEVIKKTLSLNLISIPGAFTPTEIATAYKWGAHFVKVFPAGTLGARYIKDLKGPMAHIPLLAVGGIDLNNMMEFLKSGVLGVGIGGSLANADIINSGRMDVLREKALDYVRKIV